MHDLPGGLDYALLDFGRGRRLERFGPVRVDRPAPAAEQMEPALASPWQEADARFDRTAAENGRWTLGPGTPANWTLTWRQLCFELRPTEFGQVGLFPEQVGNWEWLFDQVAAVPRPCRVLNLFAYTGGSTLAAALAGAGAEVTHVDAARNAVAWARRNAELSGLAGSAIRWIVEDARKFVRRELRRGSRYEGVILDPPSYGHGSHGEVWRLAKHLDGLLAGCVALCEGRPSFMLLTCHTPGFTAPRLRQMTAEALTGAGPGRLAAQDLVLRTVDGRTLPSGVAVRWEV